MGLDLRLLLLVVGGSLVVACIVLAVYAVGALVDGGCWMCWMLIGVALMASFWQKKLPGVCVSRSCSFHVREGGNHSDLYNYIKAWRVAERCIAVSDTSIVDGLADQLTLKPGLPSGFTFPGSKSGTLKK